MKPVVFVLILSVVLGSCTTTKMEQQYVPKENEEICGIWVNTEYSGAPMDEQKIVIYLGECEFYSMASIPVHSGRVKYTIVDKWTDSEGNIWYKRITEEHARRHELNKINKNGTTLEMVYSYIHSKFPTEIDPGHPEYHIYYRQK